MDDSSPAFTRIRKDVETHPVVLYMEGTPMYPLTARAAAVAQALDAMGIPYKSVNLVDDPEVKEAIKAFGECPDLPHLYIKGRLAGGGDAARDLAKSEGLKDKLAEAGIAAKPEE
ncbi:glutaredoxin domain-containing protein [Oleispirillum naphthae]|uniref:glutaredoxin domain-containing protein n=1 Tax=Oleispirillum naphthae TaxID=2838853 RepID=UPI0030822933